MVKTEGKLDAWSWQFPPDYYKQSLQVLETSLSHVPAYRSWRSFDPGKAFLVDLRYRSLPALTKKDIRLHSPQDFAPPGTDVRRGLETGKIALVKTSGSSEVSVTNIWNQQWWDASERASWKLNSHASRLADANHREAILANPLNVGFISDGAELPLEKRRLGRFLYLNEKTDPAHWSPGHMDRMLAELEVFQPAVLEANPSLLAKLSRYAAAAKKKVFPPGLIVFTYEYPTNLHYRQIRRVFESPLASSYGTTETGYVFMQCEAGKFHQNIDCCRVDFQPVKPEHGGPWVGRILVTTFNNPWYYVLHFDVSDLVRIDPEGACPCGRHQGMILAAVEGRASSVTLTAGGRLVSQRELDNALSVLTGIDEYRLEQVTKDTYNLHLVSGRTDKSRLSAEAAATLKKLYGNEARISVIYEGSLSPESSGKYCSAKALFPIDINDYLDEKYTVKNK